MTIRDLPAIDVHGHYGRYGLGDDPLIDEMMSADAEAIAVRAKAANARLTLVSPLEGLLPGPDVCCRWGGYEGWTGLNSLASSRRNGTDASGGSQLTLSRSTFGSVESGCHTSTTSSAGSTIQ